jgi:tRNA-binding EMAP/Myf-like protein
MDFIAYPLRVGAVTAATASGDALHLTIDLGGESREAHARITERYGPDDMLGRSVVVVLDPPGAAPGEVVVLAAVSPTEGAVLLRPDAEVPPGTVVV